MKRLLATLCVFLMVTSSLAEAANRMGSHRVGGYNSLGKGSQYVGGYNGRGNHPVRRSGTR
jgi:hypothetical protein